MTRLLPLTPVFMVLAIASQVAWSQDTGYPVLNPVDGSDGTLNRRIPQTHQGDGRFGPNLRDGGTRPHNGVDIAAPYGAQVRAPEGGIVTRSQVTEPGPYSTAASPANPRRPGAGNQVVVAHPDGTTTRYYHLQSQGLPQVGQWVDQGQPIGRVGNSGNVPPLAQSHLHFEVRDSQTQPVRPEVQSNWNSAPNSPASRLPRLGSNESATNTAAPSQATNVAPRSTLTFDENAPRTPAITPRQPGASAPTASLNLGR